MASFTELNRKTVLASLKWLEESELITPEKRYGTSTNYRLNMAATGPKNGTASRRDTSTNFGTGRAGGRSESSTKKGTAPVPNLGPVPKTVPVPNTTADQYQIRPEPVPNLGHNREIGNDKEKTPPLNPPQQSEAATIDDNKATDLLGDQSTQGSASGKPARFVAAHAPLPEEVDRDNWKRWCEFRSQRRKPVTLQAAKLAISMLAKYSPDVQRQIVTNSIQNDYQGLFEPKGNTDAGTSTRGNPEADRRSKAERIRDEIYYGSF
jgi:hypothetical protein